MPVPLLDLQPQNHPLEPELTEAFRRVLRSNQFILGPELESFETALAARLGVRHALGVSSGTDAILLALMSLGIGPGDEVIVPAFTFFATAGCVSRVGAVPVFADVCPVCFNLDPASVAARLTPRTRAIIPVHLFGQSAEMESLLALARNHGLRVIEDAAQALGAAYRGRPVGGLGDFGTFSFFPSKNLGALGDAGLLVTQEDALAEKARLLRVHGAKPKYYHHLIGANFRMDPLQAAFLAVKLPHYDAYNLGRARNAADYCARLTRHAGARVASLDASTCGGGAGTSETPGAAGGLAGPAADLVLPVAYPHNTHLWNQFTLRVRGAGRRDALRAHLQSRGVGTEIYYPVPLHRQPCFQSADSPAPTLPVSEQLAAEVLSLPIYPELTEAQRAEVAGAILEFLDLHHG